MVSILRWSHTTLIRYRDERIERAENNLIRPSEVAGTALNPKDDCEESTRNDQRSRHRRIVYYTVTAIKQKQQLGNHNHKCLCITKPDEKDLIEIERCVLKPDGPPFISVVNPTTWIELTVNYPSPIMLFLFRSVCTNMYNCMYV